MEGRREKVEGMRWEERGRIWEGGRGRWDENGRRWDGGK